ncbi:lipopolysaccharide assembly protein LapA domain-containing protein [Dyella silvae]|uniref:lipopolysaccharide assembly protein LapA domain-containing protein n=1 Tax=Dyella silvae TaxID=2994424 RepID=UPI00226554EB|nr:lipopolysaccharide assembly protein LapA domain-containing protein [Dyella silvae]
MRLIVTLILLFFIAAGIVLGALNADLVGYDLGFVRLQLPKGAALLLALVIGWLLGGLTAWLGVSSRHRRQRRQASKQAGAKAKTTPAGA